MSAKNLKRITALLFCIAVAFCTVLNVSAVSDYTVSELDDMVISLPDGMSAITRSSHSSDRYFSVFGFDYNTTMQTFENSNIYFQGMDSMASVTVTVTMTKTEESKSVGNYTRLSQDELTKIRNNFIDMNEYLSCTPDQGEKLVWLIFDATTSNKGNTIKTYQANTVYDGMSVNVTMQRNEGNVTAIDYSIFSQILSSVDFKRGNLTTDMLPYVIIGGAVVIVLLIVLIAVLARRIKKRRKKQKNNAILEELANKYNLTDDSSEDISEARSSKQKSFISAKEPVEDKSGSNNDVDSKKQVEFEEIASRYSSDDEVDDIINSARAYKEALNEEAVKYNYGYEKNSSELEKKTDTTDTEAENNTEYEEISSAVASSDTIEAENSSTDNSEPTVDQIPSRKNEDGTKYADMLFGTDTSTDDEDENDEELVRQAASRNDFDNGYDFFEEAPKKVSGVIDSEDIKNASDYDVMNEEEQKAARVRTQGEKQPNPALEIIKKTGKGLKSFGIHCGYFCKNVSIMIKRKRAAAKRRKLEEERRERQRQRALRARQRNEAQRENGGLVKVHSKGSSINGRPQGHPQGRPQGARPQGARPQGRPQGARPQGRSQGARPQDNRPRNARPDFSTQRNRRR